MAKTRLNRYKIAALRAVLAFVLTQSASASLATGSPAVSAPANVKLDSEVLVVQDFWKEFLKLEEDVVVAHRKPSLTHEDISKLLGRRDELKKRWAQVQQALRAAINKLKAAGEWESLDERALAGLGDGSVRGLLKSVGGAKRLWEDTAVLTVSSDYDGALDLTALNRKLKAEARVTHSPAVPKDGLLFKCRLVLVLQNVSQGIPSSQPPIDVVTIACFR